MHYRQTAVAAADSTRQIWRVRKNAQASEQHRPQPACKYCPNRSVFLPAHAPTHGVLLGEAGAAKRVPTLAQCASCSVNLAGQ